MPYSLRDLILHPLSAGLIVVASMATSTLFFIYAPPGTTLRRRLLMSAHGVAVTAVFASTFVMAEFRYARPKYWWIHNVLYLIPAGLIVASLYGFKGPRALHALHTLNAAAMAFSAYWALIAMVARWT